MENARLEMQKYQLGVELVVLSIDLQIGDPRVESQVIRVDGNFFGDPGLIID